MLYTYYKLYILIVKVIVANRVIVSHLIFLNLFPYSSSPQPVFTMTIST